LDTIKAIRFTQRKLRKPSLKQNMGAGLERPARTGAIPQEAPGPLQTLGAGSFGGYLQKVYH
jgi:hypothetical protein